MTYGKLILGPRDKAVYKWEADTVRSWDKSRLGHAVAHSVVQHVWRDMGLIFPPKVTFDPKIPDGGYGTRTELTFKGPPSHVVLFHEMAHAMDTTVEEEAGYQDWGGSSHNDNWLGLYVDLMDRYMGGEKFNKITSLATLGARGITFAMSPKPRCI